MKYLIEVICSGSPEKKKAGLFPARLFMVSVFSQSLIHTFDKVPVSFLDYFSLKF